MAIPLNLLAIESKSFENQHAAFHPYLIDSVDLDVESRG